MLLAILVVLFLLHRRRWYGYGPCWGYPYYRGYGPYGAASYGYVWNGYSWQPNYGSYYVYPYGYYRRPYGW
ncbi:hypothetical protein [Terriglobus sp.]|uniref:hypothetical protein n=1 Tax=Terriglobus sp. TaxID=1889013 RepID=UPI003B00F363